MDTSMCLVFVFLFILVFENIKGCALKLKLTSNPDLCSCINMVLKQQIQTRAECLALFIEADIPQIESDTYITTFTDNRITELTMSKIDNQMLLDIEINTLGCMLLSCHMSFRVNLPSIVCLNVKELLA